MTELIPGFKTTRWSDLKREGMVLELIETETGDETAEIFYSDQTSKMTISIFKSDIPVEVIDKFIEKAKKDLSPIS